MSINVTTVLGSEVPFRDNPLPIALHEHLAHQVCDALKADPRTADRMRDGRLSPIEVARMAVLVLPIDERYTYPEGTEADCIHCGERILLDQMEGGGPGKDWGTSPEDWKGHGGSGMDYGCGEHPLSGSQGCYGHEPNPPTVRRPLDAPWPA